jgi:hypothetical protein
MVPRFVLGFQPGSATCCTGIRARPAFRIPSASALVRLPAIRLAVRGIYRIQNEYPAFLKFNASEAVTTELTSKPDRPAGALCIFPGSIRSGFYNYRKFTTIFFYTLP